MAVDVADLVVGKQVVIMRQHARSLPGRAVQRALVTGSAYGLDETSIKPILHLVQEGGRVEQPAAGSVLLAGQMIAAEKPGIELRHDVRSRQRLTRMQSIVPDGLEFLLRAVPLFQPARELFHEALLVRRTGIEG